MLQRRQSADDRRPALRGKPGSQLLGSYPEINPAVFLSTFSRGVIGNGMFRAIAFSRHPLCINSQPNQRIQSIYRPLL